MKSFRAFQHKVVTYPLYHGFVEVYCIETRNLAKSGSYSMLNLNFMLI